MILMDTDLDMSSALDRFSDGLCREDCLDSLWPWDQNIETSALNYPGLLLDSEDEEKGSLVRNDVVLSEGFAEAISKQEHSYSCSIASDGDSVPSSPLSLDMQDDMESECFPCIPLKKASHHSLINKGLDQNYYIKSEPSSPPLQPSFRSTAAGGPAVVSSPAPALPNSGFRPITHPAVTIKKEPESYFQIKEESTVPKPQQSLLKQSPITRILCPKVSIKLEDGGSISVNSISSLSSSITTSASGSSMLTTRQRILPAVRHAISSPLISTQLKGSSGMLCLTEEEKRTLVSEGYPIPTNLPLSKSEERSLKKIRRKIKNKISAQESRRKKKEYMDSLERKYDIIQSEANSWRAKAEALQAKNAALSKQICDMEERLKAAATEQKASAMKTARNGSMNASMNGSMAYILPVDQQLSLEPDSMQGKSDFPDLSSGCLDIDVD